MPKTLGELAGIMKDIDFAMLSTHSDAGSIAGRPMSNNRDVAYDGDSWYFAYEETRVVRELRADPQVGLGFHGKGGMLGMKPVFLHVEGQATIIQDKAQFEAHWTPDLDRWFENGVETPGLTLIHVRGTRLHYWDGEEQGELVLTGATADTVATQTS